MTDITQRLRFADIRELRTAADMAGLSQEFAALVYDHQRLQADADRLRAALRGVLLWGTDTNYEKSLRAVEAARAALGEP